jgi:RHS repeat-associated protein
MRPSIHGLIALALWFMVLAMPARAADTTLSETPETPFGSADAQALRDKASELATPVAIYEYVRNDFEHALYHGARSNAVNTFLGQRGNAVDLSSTLIALYRSRGMPARYVVGKVQVKAGDAQNWLGVRNLDLAVGILNDQGIQGVILAADRSYVEFEHVWTEVLVPFLDYRGAGPGSTGVHCTTTPNRCTWIALDPSFKRKRYPAAPIDIHDAVSFDYTAYYHAIKNNDESRKDKNPLQIHEKAILDYLRANHPGKGLADVLDVGEIIAEAPGILPASLPYQTVGTLRRYNSVADHDAAENPDWRKWLTVTVDLNGRSLPGIRVSVPDLSTQRLTFAYEKTPSPAQVLRLDGAELLRVALNGAELDGAGRPVQLGSRFEIRLDMEGRARTDGSGQSAHDIESYKGQVMGGMQLIGSGGETSNFGGVRKAAERLLAANQQYAIAYLYDAQNNTYIPYVDANRNGAVDAGEIKLIDHAEAMQALTGGLLDLAMRQYLVRVRESQRRIDALGHAITPIDSIAGLASSVYDAEYYGDIPFSILPGGLLIDVKGITVQGPWRTHAAEQRSEKLFLLFGHMTSALEHEIWQDLTGFDAISTVRGIQVALANGATLVNPKKNATTDNLPSLYSQFGYLSAPQTPFQMRTSTVFDNRPTSWYLNPDDGVARGFTILKKRIDPATPVYKRRGYEYASNNGWDAFITSIDSAENRMNADIATYGSGCTYPHPGWTWGGQQHYGACTTVRNELRAYWVANIGTDLFNLLDQNQGFISSDYVYRDLASPPDAVDTETIQILRDSLYLQNPMERWAEFLIPNKQAYGPHYRFSVFLLEGHAVSDNSLTSMLFGIQNNAFTAGGGYVDIGTVVVPSIPLSEGSAITPAYSNAAFTSKHLIAKVNNDPVKTPSSADPISTVTGNNYHDETDFFIRGRGLDYAYTRTYNSGRQATSVDGVLGVGWTHSYAMRLKSNDWGDCPDCAAGTGAGKRPENGNGITASISYVDERGGEHLYLVNEATKAVTAPKGEFDTLSFDTPQAGFHTLAFRNGVKYVFQVPGSGVLKNTPNVTARLARIEDPHGNVLNLSYDAAGQLTNVRDNLNIATRTGLTFAYHPNGRLRSVSDWTGRQWQYSYDSNGNLDFALDPLHQKIDYAYQSGGNGPHDLTEVILPLARFGQPVKTAFRYYRNGRAFAQTNGLGQGDSLEYDLYRRSTRVTDARGHTALHSYDANGALVQLNEPDGGVLTFDHQGDGLRYRKYDALGHATQYSYRLDKTFGTAADSFGQVTRARDALNQEVDYGYGMYDQVTSVKNRRGHTRRYVYAAATAINANGYGDFKGKLKEVRADVGGQPDVLLASHAYDAHGNPYYTREYLEPGNTARFRQTDWFYDADGLYLDYKLVSQSADMSQPLVYVDYQYDSLGRLVAETLYRKERPDPNDPHYLALTTTYAYDALDRPIEVTDASGTVHETVYDANGQVYQEKTWYPSGVAKAGCAAPAFIDGRSYVICADATHQYDAAERRIASTDVFGHTTQFGYDAAGNLTKVTDANGHTTRYEYDSMNRRTATIDANGHRTTTQYNPRGEIVSVTNANGETIRSEYDALGRLTKLTDPLGYETRYQYDANGNLTCRIDANALGGLQPVNSDGCTESRSYDELDRLKQVKDAQNHLTQYGYDLLGHRTTVTDAEGRLTRFRYDDLGRLTEVIDPLVETPTDLTVKYAWDEAFNLTQETDRKGQVTRHTYDKRNRKVRTDALTDGGIQTWSYDGYGDLRGAVVAGTVAYTYRYDAKHRLTQKTDGRLNKTLDWTYDAVGNLASKIDYQGKVTTYQYDGTDRLVAETNPEYLQVGYHYDGAGRLLDRILSNGAHTRYGWDAAGRLTQLQNTTLTGQVINDTTYTRDRIGNLLTQSETAGPNPGTTTYTYDAQYRLKTADYPGSAHDELFTYDKVGNRKTHTKGSLTPNAHTRHYAHDAGNRLKDIRIGSATGPIEASFSYDANGSLLTETGPRAKTITWNAQNRPSQINGNTFQYDPSGYRIRKTDSQGTKLYLLEGEHLEAIYATTGTPQATYFRGTVIDEIVNGYQLDGNNKLVNYTYHHDALQSVLGQSGHEGSLLATQSYGAFGNSLASTGTSHNRLLYTGRELDSDTGCLYYRARYYCPGIDRFISEDPLGFESGDVNFYAYVGNNPVNANDPTGHCPSCIGAGVSVLTGGAIRYFTSGGDWNSVFNSRTIAMDAVLGAAGAGLANKFSTLSQLSKVNSAAVPGNKLGQIGEALAGIAPTGKTAIPSISGTATRRFPDAIDSLKNIVEVKNVAKISSRDVAQITDSVLYSQRYGGTTTLLTRGAATDISTVQSLVNDGLLTLGKIPGINSSGVANLTTSTSASIGFGAGTFSSWANSFAGGGYLLYPNKINSNMMESVYSK